MRDQVLNAWNLSSLLSIVLSFLRIVTLYHDVNLNNFCLVSISMEFSFSPFISLELVLFLSQAIKDDDKFLLKNN